MNGNIAGYERHRIKTLQSSIDGVCGSEVLGKHFTCFGGSTATVALGCECAFQCLENDVHGDNTNVCWDPGKKGRKWALPAIISVRVKSGRVSTTARRSTAPESE
jgi:hypothetical protein